MFKAFRLFGDIRAALRGPGPLAKRVVRRQVYRTVRAKMVKTPNSRYIPTDVKLAVMRRDNLTCRHCGATGIPLQFDHVVPFSWGGGNDEENIQLLCPPCNRHKSDNYIG